MNRLDFFMTLIGGCSMALCASGAPQSFRGKRRVTEYSHDIGAPPEKVFPLLCPVREYEWLDTWACELIYSQSGVAEDDCIFRTGHSGEPMTWSVSRYEPPKRIEFVAVTPQRHVMHLKIALEPFAGGTRLRWERVFTGLTESGNERINEWNVEMEKALSEKLDYFLKTGKMLAGAKT
jgi:hypothetical protein